MAKSKPDAFLPLYVADYLADTAHLSLEEHGAYLLILLAYWRNGGPLPDDDNRFKNIIKKSKNKWLKLKLNIAPFFTIEGGLWVSKRSDIEIERAKNLIKSRALARVGVTQFTPLPER